MMMNDILKLWKIIDELNELVNGFVLSQSSNRNYLNEESQYDLLNTVEDEVVLDYVMNYINHEYIVERVSEDELINWTNNHFRDVIRNYINNCWEDEILSMIDVDELKDYITSEYSVEDFVEFAWRY